MKFQNKNIVLHQVQVDGSIMSFKEFQPELGGDYPQFLQIDPSGKISWINLSDIKAIKLVTDTTRDLFEVIDEQQERLDKITKNINTIRKLILASK